ncbi:MAG: DUF389 domain-containing protein [Flavobacteriales bacterium]|nr:DUF389 domain-containing protein [Flavobacteriales bacterium]
MGIIKKVFEFIDLHSGEEEKNKVLENVRSNTSFRGSNLWILACAIAIASIGLNVNSTAVVIGAMLISPLMGPIVGAGFALGTYDFELLKKSLKNLIIATLVGLLVSALYFYMSPFKEAQSEILSRTSPNIYDVLIAFFGGLVGVIAVTRVEKGNPIPGVAIATALMPPLCTAGYALAIGNYVFLAGSMYLYTINCVFICIATFIIVKYLKYPIAKIIAQKDEAKIKNYIYLLIFVMIIPSIYFAYQLFQEKSYYLKVNSFIEKEFTNNGHTLIYKNINFNSNPKEIKLAFLNEKFSKDKLKSFNQKLKEYSLNNSLLMIKQDTFNLKDDILNELKFYKIKDDKEVIINKLKSELEIYKFDNTQLIKEVGAVFPNVENVSLAFHSFYQDTDSTKIIPVLVVKKREITTKEEQKDSIDEKKLVDWMKQRLHYNEVLLYYKD